MERIAKIVLTILKKVVLAFCYIYAFNFIAAGLDLFIPINIVTIIVVSILGLPGLIALIGIYYILN